MTASVLYFGFIVLVTACGLALTRVGTNTGHVLASAAAAFGCVLAAAIAAIIFSLSIALNPM